MIATAGTFWERTRRGTLLTLIYSVNLTPKNQGTFYLLERHRIFTDCFNIKDEGSHNIFLKDSSILT